MRERHTLGSHQSNLCELCGVFEESEQHLWFECTYIQQVSTIIWRWLGVTVRMHSLREWFDWFDGDPKKKHIIFQTKLMALCSIVYHTWRARNLAIFHGTRWSVDECAKVIITTCKDRLLAKYSFSTFVERNCRRKLLM